MTRSVRAECPFCAFPNEVPLEGEAPQTELTTDCENCCRPFELRVRQEADGTVELDVGLS